jgi:hypothetical protein
VFTVVAMASALTASLPGPARAEIGPTPVPAEIQVPPGDKAFLEGNALGTQNYVCVPAGSAFTWRLFTPQAGAGAAATRRGASGADLLPRP